MASQYVGSVQHAAVVQWAASTAYIVGDIRRQLAAPAQFNERCFRCTTAGTSGGTEPAWNLTAGSTTNDGTCVWTEVTGSTTYAWAAPHALIRNACQSGWLSLTVAGEIIYVANNHNGLHATGVTTQFATNMQSGGGPTLILSVNPSGSVPPTASDLSPGAIEGCTGAVNITFSGFFTSIGVAFSGTNGASLGNIAFTSCGATIIDGSIRMPSTNAGGTINLGSGSNAPAEITLINTYFVFGNVGQLIRPARARIEWRDTPNAIQGSVPTTLIHAGTEAHSTLICRGVDLSALGSGKNLANNSNSIPVDIFLEDCNLDAALNPLTTGFQPYGTRVYLTRSRINSNYDVAMYDDTVTMVSDTAVYRTNGASDGTQSLSWRVTSTDRSRYLLPVRLPALSIWNAVSGATVNVTMEGLAFRATLPSNDEVWFDVQYQGSASSGMASFAKGGKASPLHSGAAHAAIGSAWDAGATAWAASTAYPIGTIRKLASNPGRLFRVESISGTGTSAGTEPAGFASALDGTTVVDNPGANQITWRACTRFSMTVPLSSPQPAKIGTIYVRPFMTGNGVAATYYLDPEIQLG